MYLDSIVFFVLLFNPVYLYLQQLCIVHDTIMIYALFVYLQRLPQTVISLDSEWIQQRGAMTVSPRFNCGNIHKKNKGNRRAK